MSEVDVQAEMDAEWAGMNGRSIADRAETFEDHPDEPEEQLEFPMGFLDGGRKTLKNLIRAGQKVEVTASLRSEKCPVRDGSLFDPETPGECLVTYMPEKVEVVPKRDRETKVILGWEIRQVLRPTYVQDAVGMLTKEQVLDLFAEFAPAADMAKLVAALETI